MNLRNFLWRSIPWFRAPRAEATTAVVWTEVSELVHGLHGEVRPIVIDVRGADEFEGELGHIPDARNIALSDLPARIAELERFKTDEIVLVCKTQMRSAKAAGLLMEAGFRRVSVLRGGMVEWVHQHGPVQPAPSARRCTPL